MNDIIVSKVTLGKCQEFCPQKEYKLRIREKLVHKYEYSEVSISFNWLFLIVTVERNACSKVSSW